MEIIIILLLILLNGVFSMSEIALVSARKSKLETAARNGDRQAQAALDLSSTPTRLLSTVQIGITLIGILLGIYSGDSLTAPVQTYLEQFEFVKPYSHPLAVGLVVLLTGYVSLVLGELVPKRIGMSNPEGIAKLMATPMTILSKITQPFIWLLGASSDVIIKALRLKPKDNSVTGEEIKSLMEEGKSGGTIEEIEQEIVQNVFHLGDRRITSLMTNRQEVIYLDLDDEVTENKQRIVEHKHSTYPLCKDGLDNIIGLIYVKDMLGEDLDVALTELEKYKRDILYIAENNKAYQALEKFQEKRIHFATIVDEYGAVLGVVTLNDILDALVGDLSVTDEFDFEIFEREDGSYLIDAQLPFEDFLNHFEITAENKKDLVGFDTLGGFAMHIIEDIPETGEKFVWQNFEFEIVDMDKSRIDKILMTRLASS